MPMPDVYAKQGFERHEIMSMTSWERENGVVHEASNFNSGNEIEATAHPSEQTHTPSKEVVQELARDVAAAVATDPIWR